MIAAADQPGSGITDLQVAGNVFTMLLAGEDTTANTIAWMIDLLWRHPAALQCAADEVHRVVGDSALPTFEQLAQLDYVEACTHETMRLKPVAPILALQAKHDTQVGDVQVTSGTMVINLKRRDSLSVSYLPRAAAFEPAGPSSMCLTYAESHAQDPPATRCKRLIDGEGDDNETADAHRRDRGVHDGCDGRDPGPGRRASAGHGRAMDHLERGREEGVPHRH